MKRDENEENINNEEMEIVYEEQDRNNQQPAKKQCNLWRPWEHDGSEANSEPEKNNQQGGSKREEQRGEKEKKQEN